MQRKGATTLMKDPLGMMLSNRNAHPSSCPRNREPTSPVGTRKIGLTFVNKRRMKGVVCVETLTHHSVHRNPMLSLRDRMAYESDSQARDQQGNSNHKSSDQNLHL